MIHRFHEDIRFPDRTKNVGYVLANVKNGNSFDILHGSIGLFFGGFGNHAIFCSNDRYAFCVRIPERLQKLDLVSIYCENGDFAFIEGTFYDRDTLVRFKQSHDRPINSAFARWVFNSAMTGGADPLKRINGHYSGFVYLSAQDRLYCFNDRFGLEKQFIYQKKSCFLVSNNVFALTANPHLDVSVDEQAVGEILQLDYPLERRTEFSNISHILPGEVLIREKETTAHVEVQTLVFDREGRVSAKKSIQELYDRFDAFMKFLASYLDEPIGLFLSRGKDSRMFLHFLEKYHDYRLFTFMTRESEWSLMEGEDIERIAALLSQDLYRLEEFTIDRRTAQMAGMNTTATSSWMALAQVAAGHIDYGIIGHGGDVLSGKLEKFRYRDVRTTRDYLHLEFDLDCKGVTRNDISASFPHLRKQLSVMETYFAMMDNSDTTAVHDFEIEHMIKHRWFRHSVPIQHKTHHYLTPVYPYLENGICDAYCRLPVRLIESQRAHAVLAAMEKKSGPVPSTEFPIALRTEQHIRPAMMSFIRFNNRLNDKILNHLHKKRIREKAVEAPRPYEIRSSYFRQTIGDRIELENRQLLHRLKLTDAFLALALDSDLSSCCNRPESSEYLGDNPKAPLWANASKRLSPVADSVP